MAAKKYTMLRIPIEVQKVLDERLKRVNSEDLKKLGIYNKKVNKIDFTSYILKTRIYIPDSEIARMAKKKWGGRLC